MYAPKATLCFSCSKSCVNGCSWAESFTPVEGWTAEPHVSAAGVASFTVSACPEFVKEPEEGRIRELDTDGCLALVERLLELTRQDYIEGTTHERERIEKFIRGHGAARLHRIEDPEAVIAHLSKEAAEYDKRPGKLARRNRVITAIKENPDKEPGIIAKLIQEEPKMVWYWAQKVRSAKNETEGWY